MVATVSVYYDYGGVDGTPATSVDIDPLGPPTLRFKNADNATIDTNDKVTIPTAGGGPNYSYIKQIYLHCDNPDGHVITNVKLYSDGTNGYGTGIDLMVGLQFPTRYYDAAADVYTGYEVSNNANEMVTEHGGITSSASIFNYTSASPLAVSINALQSAPPGSQIDAAHETTNYVCLQANISNTASIESTASETFYWAYTEA